MKTTEHVGLDASESKKTRTITILRTLILTVSDFKIADSTFLGFSFRLAQHKGVIDETVETHLCSVGDVLERHLLASAWVDPKHLKLGTAFVQYFNVLVWSHCSCRDSIAAPEERTEEQEKATHCSEEFGELKKRNRVVSSLSSEM
jgi:hypothetical protein